MHRFAVLTFILATMTTSTASTQINTESVLVGFTSATFQGDTGYLGFTTACEAEFPNTRMCASEEVIGTRRIPEGLAGTAWVRPVFALLRPT